MSNGVDEIQKIKAYQERVLYEITRNQIIDDSFDSHLLKYPPEIDGCLLLLFPESINLSVEDNQIKRSPEKLEPLSIVEDP